MSDRSVRSLLLLEHSASTARVLNLHRAWKKLEGVVPDDPPFFRNPMLDRCLIIKHRLRRNEADVFADRRSAATKVMLPLDSNDLKLGARSFFIGQNQIEQALDEMFGPGFCDGPDYKLLTLLDGLPTLDPFLLRETLKRNNYNPARRYFEVSDADLARMFSFVQAEITPLVNMSFSGAGGGASDAATAKLVSKILQSKSDDDMEPLRLTLRLAKHEYEEGVFCWKGFLYYKWCLGEIIGHVTGVLEDIARVKPVGPQDADTKEYIERSRQVLRKTIVRACSVTKATLQVYDDAYANLTQNGRPSAFREFLLDAPHLFSALGQRLGAVNHVVSFWRYRFPAGQTKGVTVEELMDIFMDFETGLNFEAQDAVAAAAGPPASNQAAAAAA